MVLSKRPRHFYEMHRNVIIAVSVVIFHIAALWIIQSGLLRRTVELIVPIEILVEIIESPAPQVIPPLPVPAIPIKQAISKAAAPLQTVAPQPLAMADPTRSTNAPTGVITLQPSAPPVAAPVTAVPPAPARVELPSSDADYLQNPAPPYPPISKRLGEQGKVVVRVFIEVDGTAQKAEIKQRSGFDRLDQAAFAAAKAWRYVPGKRGGVPEAMWVDVPIAFTLTN